jgi:acyl carrier protein
MNIDTTTPLLSSGVIDSLGIAELGEILSSAFSVHISIDQLGFDNADTPEQLAEIVSKAT